MALHKLPTDADAPQISKPFQKQFRGSSEASEKLEGRSFEPSLQKPHNLTKADATTPQWILGSSSGARRKFIS
eukprot:9108221-Pyramimonas_sp.AAC.1